VGRFSLDKRKSSEVWPVPNQEHLVEVQLNKYKFCPFLASIYFP